MNETTHERHTFNTLLGGRVITNNINTQISRNTKKTYLYGYNNIILCYNII